jgi:hypothetical protein
MGHERTLQSMLKKWDCLFDEIDGVPKPEPLLAKKETYDKLDAQSSLKNDAAEDDDVDTASLMKTPATPEHQPTTQYQASTAPHDPAASVQPSHAEPLKSQCRRELEELSALKAARDHMQGLRQNIATQRLDQETSRLRSFAQSMQRQDQKQQAEEKAQASQQHARWQEEQAQWARARQAEAMRRFSMAQVESETQRRLAVWQQEVQRLEAGVHERQRRVILLRRKLQLAQQRAAERASSHAIRCADQIAADARRDTEALVKAADSSRSQYQDLLTVQHQLNEKHMQAWTVMQKDSMRVLETINHTHAKQLAKDASMYRDNQRDAMDLLKDERQTLRRQRSFDESMLAFCLA